jgi:phenylacetic acid degradation protein
MIAWKSEGTRLYQQLPAQCFETLRPCEPLRDAAEQKQGMETGYRPWKNNI